jgi:hypothetical protein
MNSDSTVAQIDELLKEYLAFRGFTATLKTFEIERKNDKTKSYQVFKKKNFSTKRLTKLLNKFSLSFKVLNTLNFLNIGHF